jgi:hypothetical protein
MKRLRLHSKTYYPPLFPDCLLNVIFFLSSLFCVSSQHSISHFSSIVSLFFPLSSQILLATLAVDVLTKIVLCRKRNTDNVRPVVSKSGITMRPITFMGGFNAGEEFAWFTAKAAMVTGVSHDHAPSLLMAMIPYICHLIR